MSEYENQMQHAVNLLNAYLAVKDHFYTFQLAVEKLCPLMMRAAPGADGRQIFADIIRLDQWYWDEEVFDPDDCGGMVRCENLIVTTDANGFVELKVCKSSADAEEAFANLKYLVDDRL